MACTRFMFLSVSVMMAGLICAAPGEEGFLRNNVAWLVEAGVFHGSIVGRKRIDAVSGATRTSVSASTAAEVKVLGQYVSAGVNIEQTGQSIDYKDTANSVTGTRDISLVLLDLPLLYNIHLLKQPSGGRDNPRLVLSIGGFVSFVLSKRMDETGTPAPYHMASGALGPYLRVVGYPFAFGRFQPGLFLNFYRSFVPRFYDDVYFRQNSISGQLGILSAGLSMRF
jgi:hypothetical protein